MLVPVLNALVRGLGRWHGRAVTHDHLRRLQRIDPRLLDDAGIGREAAAAEIGRLAWQPHVVVAEAPAAPAPDWAEARSGAHRPLAPRAALR